ncbi:hypothetical protein OAN80_01870, partial [Alphaproteobacteria bacterium]|nr:hypothetical protein [Alphaproteobacteria bacterium]
LVNALDGADGFRADHSGLAGAGSSGVAGIGDINGDTLDDMAAGLPTTSPDLRGGAGSTHVIFGDQASFSAVIQPPWMQHRASRLMGKQPATHRERLLRVQVT